MHRIGPTLAILGLFACGPSISPEDEDKKQNAEAWIEAAFSAYQKGQFESAAKHYNQALVLVPDNVIAGLGYADSVAEWADDLLEQAMRMFMAGKNGGPEDLRRSLQTVNPLVEKATKLQNAAQIVYHNMRDKFKTNRTVYMRSTFGLSKLHYYRIISPHSVYAFAEVEEKEINGKKVTEIKDPLVVEAVKRDREDAIKFLEEFVGSADDQAVESRRWLAALLAARNGPGDSKRALTLLEDYLKRLQEIRAKAEKSITDKNQLKIYVEFIEREIRATSDAIAMLKAG
jgi:tetratricopeptide (TPR) repeat protein